MKRSELGVARAELSHAAVFSQDACTIRWVKSASPRVETVYADALCMRSPWLRIARSPVPPMLESEQRTPTLLGPSCAASV
eukprot:3933993-Rhodomonas_salina.4